MPSTASPDKPTFGFGGYAGWFTRVGAYLIDYVLGLVAGIPAVFGYVLLFTSATTTTDPQGVKHLHLHQTGATAALIGLGVLTGLAFQIWNVYIRQGRTGASVGKSVLAIRLVNSDFQPIGAGMVLPPVAPAHPGCAALLHRLPVADLGLPEADLRRQDHEHLRHPGDDPAAARVLRARPAFCRERNAESGSRGPRLESTHG